MKRLQILGIRGVPAAHGGFETFAEHLALYLVDRGWAVTVYCQEEGQGSVTEDHWQGVHRVRIPVATPGSLGTVVFDWHAIRLAVRHGGLCLTLGYNTAVLCARLRLAGLPNVINMDGIEWQRAKWGMVAKLWFMLNEQAGCLLGDHLVADHPEIASHLGRRAPPSKISTIAYGAERLQNLDDAPVRALGLQPGRYLTLIARPEPENSVLEVVQGYGRQRRGLPLVVLGTYREEHAYHRRVRQAAGPEVRFVGAIYDKQQVQALRLHSLAYVHGHQVGGTNPSLVEALGAGNPVLAHDNRFNRWVAAEAALYFSGADTFSERVQELLDSNKRQALLRRAASARFEEAFTWPRVLKAYETLLTRMLAPGYPR